MTILVANLFMHLNLKEDHRSCKAGVKSESLGLNKLADFLLQNVIKLCCLIQVNSLIQSSPEKGDITV